MKIENNWAVAVPMANEEPDFEPFIAALRRSFDRLEGGRAYLVVDRVSRDRTHELCAAASAQDPRFITLWRPENRSVVDAYLAGFRQAYADGLEFVIEMDAGMSHDPAALPMFLRVLNEGNDCAFGSRFISGGSNQNAPLKRRLLSWGGTVLANLLLGTRMHDMTSGYEGFERKVIAKILQRPLRSTGHFYQTEIRYLLRHERGMEVPIHYRAPSPRVRAASILNSFSVLGHYAVRRLTLRADSL